MLAPDQQDTLGWNILAEQFTSPVVLCVGPTCLQPHLMSSNLASNLAIIWPLSSS